MKEIYDQPFFPDIVFNGRTYTNADIVPAVENLADILRWQHTNNKSPFVHLAASNHIKTIVAWFAIMQARLNCVLIDPELRWLDLEHIRTDTPPCAVIRTSDSPDDLDFQQDILLPPGAPGTTFPVDMHNFTMLYTAAEDGTPKAAMISIENFMTNAHDIIEVNHLTADSVSCALLPFSHFFSLGTNIFAPILTHSKMLVLNPSPQKLSSNVAAIAEHKVTHFYTVPILYYLILRESSAGNPLKQAFSLTCGGYKLPEMIYKLWSNKTGQVLQEGYGLTEASPVCTWHRPGDAIKIESVGRAFPSCQIAILDEQDNELPAGTPGEVCVRGKQVMAGYYNQTDATLTTLRNGWLHTGDLGYLDSEGYLCLTGLKKHMVHVGGRNVYPAELERLIRRHPNVESIELSWTESPMVGAKIKGRIFLKARNPANEKEFMQWCITNIAAYKLPKEWEFV